MAREAPRERGYDDIDLFPTFVTLRVLREW